VLHGNCIAQSCLDCSLVILTTIGKRCDAVVWLCLQRVMAWPGGVRFHYGHPDLWNRLWVMTRGGVSKSTRWPPLLLTVVPRICAFVKPLRVLEPWQRSHSHYVTSMPLTCIYS
jgi:1,3-beta-glucan synthase component